MIGNDLQPNDGLLPPQREYQIHILTTVLSIAMTSRVCTDFSKPHPQFKGVILARFFKRKFNFNDDNFNSRLNYNLDKDMDEMKQKLIHDGGLIWSLNCVM